MSSKLFKQRLEVAADVLFINIDLRAQIIAFKCFLLPIAVKGSVWFYLLNVALHTVIYFSEISHKSWSVINVRIIIVLVL